MQELPTINAETIGLIIDVALIIGVFFLWLTWHRNGKRQQKMEQILADTAHQLEEASRHLNQATQAIEHIKRQEKNSTAKMTRKKPPRSNNPYNAAPIVAPAENSTHTTMVLRMKREGESEESIAEKLGMPIAQVRLVLKLHAASSPAIHE